MTRKILCIQLKRIGDVLMTTPAVRAISNAFPKAEIHFLTEPPSNQIYQFNPYVKEVISIGSSAGFMEHWRLLKKLRAEKYDTVIDFFGQQKSAVISWLTRATKRIGFNFRGRAIFYTDARDLPKNVKYAAEDKLFLATALGCNVDDSALDFFVDEADRETARSILGKLKINEKRPLMTVSPVSRRDYKVWPPEKFAAVCDRLVRDRDAQILFLWGPGEESFVKAVRLAMKETSLPDYDIPTLRETVALLELADLHLGNDNGPMHFAVAARRPSVAVYGRPKMENWLPPASKIHFGVEHDPGCKNSCRYPDCGRECVLDVPVEEVWKLSDGLLAKN